MNYKLWIPIDACCIHSSLVNSLFCTNYGTLRLVAAKMTQYTAQIRCESGFNLGQQGKSVETHLQCDREQGRVTSFFCDWNGGIKQTIILNFKVLPIVLIFVTLTDDMLICMCVRVLWGSVCAFVSSGTTKKVVASNAVCTSTFSASTCPLVCSYVLHTFVVFYRIICLLFVI